MLHVVCDYEYSSSVASMIAASVLAFCHYVEFQVFSSQAASSCTNGGRAAHADEHASGDETRQVNDVDNAAHQLAC